MHRCRHTLGVSDLLRYIYLVVRRSLLEIARVARGLTQEAVARRSGTSQPTLSAYERGTTSPTLAVVERILHALGYELGLQPRVAFREVKTGSRTCQVPDQLWRIDLPDCFAPLTVCDAVGARRTYNLLNRETRVEAYIWLLKNGDETQLFEHLDGALLVNAWPDLVAHLPEALRTVWGPLVHHAAEGWVDKHLIAGLQEGRPRPVSPRARARAIKRLAERGLTADEIRAALHRRQR